MSTVDDKTPQNGSNTLTKPPGYPKRSQPTYRRSLSLEQSQNIKEANSVRLSIVWDNFKYELNCWIKNLQSTDLNTSLNEPVYAYRSRTVERDPSLDRLTQQYQIEWRFDAVSWIDCRLIQRAANRPLRLLPRRITHCILKNTIFTHFLKCNIHSTVHWTFSIKSPV